MNGHFVVRGMLRWMWSFDSGVRPYGVSLLVAGWDITRGPSLYQVDPSGSFWACKASAIGKNMVNAKSFLEKRCVVFIRLAPTVSN